MKKQIIRRDFNTNHSSLSDLHPLLQRIYTTRGVVSKDEVKHELAGLLPFNRLLHIDKATERLHQALVNNERILVIGDFDADGATSTAVAVSALNLMGAEHVDYIVPNRFAYGYGLTPEIVDVAKERNPNLIITVDNGISSIEGVDHANKLGIDVLVTDHHLAGKVLPNACAIVNPNQPNDEFPSKNLAGVGVIFYVMLALRAYLKEKNYFVERNIPMPNMAQFLDLVALGTVADVVMLDTNNRIMLQQGLNRIRAGLSRPGIQALLEVAGRNAVSIKAADLGFAVGPRLNAAGRLDDMSLGIACLLASSKIQALEKANELNTLNNERRAIEQQMQRDAFGVIDKLNLDQSLPLGICLFDKEWHQGVVGLVASRVKEKMNRPVIAFAKTDDNVLKGSARSIKGLHIRDVLDAIATKFPGLITKFGGHAMAAGMSIDADKFDEFQKAFAAEIKLRAKESDLQGKLETDGELESGFFALHVAEMLEKAGPWGQGFPEPLFDGEFRVFDQRVVGQRHLKMVLQVPGTDSYLDGIMFNINLDEWPNHHSDRVHLAYRLDVNEYNGRRKLQVLVEQMTVCEELVPA